MRLLITTQIVDRNDPVQSSFHAWLTEFAAHAEAITVICLKKGEYDLPENVRVFSLGKEEGRSRIKYLRRLYSYVWRFRKDYDTVFVHMNPEYVVLLGWWWKSTGKKLAMWYTHRQVNLKLRIATLFCDVIFSASPFSFRIKTPKVHFIGHGVEVEKYAPLAAMPRDERAPVIISVGRLTAIKNCDTFVEAANLIHAKNKKVQFVLVGGPNTNDDVGYEAKIRELIAKRKLDQVVTITGFVSPDEVRAWYQKASLAVNLTPPGGLDRTVIEAMAAGVPTMSSNIGYQEYLGQYAHDLIFPLRDYKKLVEKIEHFLANKEKDAMRKDLSKMAVDTFSVKSIIGKIMAGITAVQEK